MIDRETIKRKYWGRCAYCGCELLDKPFHIDHMKPLMRGCSGSDAEGAGDDSSDNLVPACPRCNLRKSILSVEGFREEIAAQSKRLLRDSAAFRLAVDYGIVGIFDNPVVFWFEVCKEDYAT